MMATWLVAAWAAHKTFTRPGTTVMIQSEDEDRALKPIDYIKILWENSSPELQAIWAPLRGRGPRDQAENEFKLANHSWVKGLVGNPEKIRSEHPTIVIFDEAAHMTRIEAAFNNARATRCHKIVALSSTAPGWFAEITESTAVIPWPWELQIVAA
jgi:hypothetical protein